MADLSPDAIPPKVLDEAFLLEGAGQVIELLPGMTWESFQKSLENEEEALP